MADNEKARRVAVYRFGSTVKLHEGSFADWNPDLIDAKDYSSPRALALFQALGADLSDYEYLLHAHKDGRWGLFGLTMPGQTYAVEE